MIRMKSFSTERAVELTTWKKDFPALCNKHCFHELFPAFSYAVIDRIPEFLSFVFSVI